jgi:hypothetical protein
MLQARRMGPCLVASAQCGRFGLRRLAGPPAASAAGLRLSRALSSSVQDDFMQVGGCPR